MMDEIICPACGRPNLAEAVKCWYCQEILENQSQPDEDEVPLQEASDDVSSPSQEEAQGPDGAETPEAEIPEWLKRIRALKEAEMKEEEERSRWQQQALFSGGVPRERQPGTRWEPKKRSQHSSPRIPPKAPPVQPPESEVVSKTQQDLPAQKDHANQTAPTNADIDSEAAQMDTPGDLPDGYVPFDRE